MFECIMHVHSVFPGAVQGYLVWWPEIRLRQNFVTESGTINRKHNRGCLEVLCQYYVNEVCSKPNSKQTTKKRGHPENGSRTPHPSICSYFQPFKYIHLLIPPRLSPSSAYSHHYVAAQPSPSYTRAPSSHCHTPQPLPGPQSQSRSDAPKPSTPSQSS